MRGSLSSVGLMRVAWRPLELDLDRLGSVPVPLTPDIVDMPPSSARVVDAVLYVGVVGGPEGRL